MAPDRTPEPYRGLTDHPLRYGIAGTRGMVALLGSDPAHWSELSRRLPAAHAELDAVRRDGADAWVVAVVDMPGGDPDACAIRPHYDAYLGPDGFDAAIPALETNILYLDVPADIIGGELVLLDDDAATEWAAAGHAGGTDRATLVGLGATLHPPAVGRRYRLEGRVCHGVLGFASSGGGRRQALIVGQFATGGATGRFVMLGGHDGTPADQ